MMEFDASITDADTRISAQVVVVIINWNSGIMLFNCLKHLELQTVQPKQIMVIDNASSDESADCVNAFKNVTLHRMESNLGFAAANNHALSVCDAEFVVLLNPDAFPAPTWLEYLLGAANAFPDIAAFGSRQLCNNMPAILDGTGDNYHVSGLVWRDRNGKKQELPDLVSKAIFSPCAAAALYRRQVLLDIGGFDEDYFCYVEDVDLGFRLRLAGYSAMYVPDAVVRHEGSATTGGRRSDFAVYHGRRNLIWTYIKNMPGILFWVFLPVHVLLNIVTIAYFTKCGQGKVILTAMSDALCGVPCMWRKRRSIQLNRNVSYLSILGAMDKRLFPRNRRS